MSSSPRRRLLWVLIAIAALSQPGQVSAHDDPIVTIRVLCNGFNVLDMDAVLGEISDSATLNVDRRVEGSSQIQAWVKEQMDDDLRIEIVDIATPERLPDGYTLNWTARLRRQDWRKAGVDAREAANTVVIHNGRITQWTAALDVAAPVPESIGAPLAQSASVGSQAVNGSVPDVLGVPLTLLLAAGVALAGAGLLARAALKR